MFGHLGTFEPAQAAVQKRHIVIARFPVELVERIAIARKGGTQPGLFRADAEPAPE